MEEVRPENAHVLSTWTYVPEPTSLHYNTCISLEQTKIPRREPMFFFFRGDPLSICVTVMCTDILAAHHRKLHRASDLSSALRK